MTVPTHKQLPWRNLMAAAAALACVPSLSQAQEIQGGAAATGAPVPKSISVAQAKLNTVVDVIGGGLDSEVCSIYLLRDGMLELFATKGLAQEAVHVTRMAIGEGLVGSIASENEFLNLAEATAHPENRP